MSNSLISIIECRQEDNSTDEVENDDEILVPTKLESTKQSFMGRVRTCANVSVIEWSFIIISAMGIGVGCGFSIFRLLTVAANSDQFIFVILVVINLLFASFYLFHGIFQEQPFEILMFMLTTILMWLLVTLNYASEVNESDQIKLIRLLVSTALSLPQVILAAIVGWRYWSSGNLVFKTVGGDTKLQNMCRMLFLGYSLLVFDAQAAISCILLILQRGITGMSEEEIVVIMFGGVFVGLWLSIGFVSMRTENMRLTWLFALTSVIQPAYVLYLFVRGLEETHGEYSIRTQCAFLAGGALLLAHFSLLASIPTISFNYGKGLRAEIYGDDVTPPPGVAMPGPSRSVHYSDEDMEPLIIPGSNRRRTYNSTETVVNVAVHGASDIHS